MTAGRYTVLAGGTGAAKFLRGLVRAVPEEEIRVIVNVGDDAEIWGLHVSPDIDSVMYALAGRLDTERGWGLRDETFRCLDEMAMYGMPHWFRLGDRDLATHLTRTRLLGSGFTLSQATSQMSRALGVRAAVLPATNDPVRTQIETPGGVLSFQEFFVRERWRPEVLSVTYAGAGKARATEAVVSAISDSTLVIVAPSNPVTSIGPIVAIDEIRDALRTTRGRVVAISPLVGRSAFSGPAAKLMECCGHEVSPSGVARCYHDFLDEIVIDVRDAALAPSIRNEMIGVRTTDIFMPDDDAAGRLAEFVVE